MSAKTQAVQSEANWHEDTMCLMLSSFSLNVLETSLKTLSLMLAYQAHVQKSSITPGA